MPWRFCHLLAPLSLRAARPSHPVLIPLPAPLRRWGAETAGRGRILTMQTSSKKQIGSYIYAFMLVMCVNKNLTYCQWTNAVRQVCHWRIKAPELERVRKSFGNHTWAEWTSCKLAPLFGGDAGSPSAQDQHGGRQADEATPRLAHSTQDNQQRLRQSVNPTRIKC